MLLVVCCLFFTGCASLPPPPTSPLADIQTLKGSAHVNIKFKDGREIAGIAAIIVKRPDRFRLEISGPFNQTAFIIIYNGEKMSLFSFQENKLYTDYPLPVEASRLPQYLLGLPASKNNGQEAEGIKVSMNSYEEIDGFNFPFAISINNKGVDIFIKYDNVQLNRQIEDDLFNWQGN